ncbi:hypothetical protein Pcinc_000300 [Petrolisthes cinctipes]|uniref:Uncharacterized protein n=1 Tax=Petrolisthes cinctipes TaxID=88211 RepID=A0AAE1GQ75_PETCI|nr:hypothetical protein Pcinc_000300 [Petrolisthes cinctipes]
MGNKQGQELSPEDKLKLKEEKDREKKLVKEEKERKKREKKEEKKRKKDKKTKRGYAEGSAFSERGDDDDDLESIGGSSGWSEKSVGSAPGSWYHSASEPSSKRSSIYLPASAGPGYYQHDCWYSGYEDSGSEKSKSPSRSPSVKDKLNLRAGSLERYPLGVPKGEPIEPLHKAGSLDLSSVAAKTYVKELSADAELAATIASRYEETIRSSRDHLEKSALERISVVDKATVERLSFTDRSILEPEKSTIERVYPPEKSTLERSLPDKASQGDRASLVERTSLTSSVYYSAEEGSVRGEKRKALENGREARAPWEAHGGESDPKRLSLDYASDRTSVTGSVYYSADEGGSLAGSIYYSATSGSEVEDHVDDQDLLGKGKMCYTTTLYFTPQVSGGFSLKVPGVN